MPENAPTISKATMEDTARQINELAQTLYAVSQLEYHDKNFLTNPKSCCTQQQEYLRQIMRLASSLMGANACDKRRRFLPSA